MPKGCDSVLPRASRCAERPRRSAASAPGPRPRSRCARRRRRRRSGTAGRRPGSPGSASLLITSSRPGVVGASPARAVMASGLSSPGLRVTTTRRAAPARPSCSAVRPSHRSRQPRQAAERNRSRTGAADSTTAIRQGVPSGAHADDVVGRGGGVVGVGRDGPEPAQNLGRRLVHGTFDDSPGSASSSPVISTTLRPWPHQRQTTSSTLWASTCSSSTARSPPTL